MLFLIYCPTMTPDNFRKKLLYRSLHRGCKETDLILGNFATKYIHNMTYDELLEWEQILNQPDSDIVSWVIRGAEVPKHLYSAMMKKLINL